MTDQSIPKTDEVVKPLLVFFYGSLRTGEYNHGLLAKSTKVADAVINGFDLYSLGAFPAVILSTNPSNQVYGEVFEVDPTEFLRIDRMERGAGYFAHEVHAVQTEDLDKTTYQCLVYVFRDAKWLQDIGEVVELGDWVKRDE